MVYKIYGGDMYEKRMEWFYRRRMGDRNKCKRFYSKYLDNITLIGITLTFCVVQLKELTILWKNLMHY